jgi:hypothetical protein
MISLTLIAFGFLLLPGGAALFQAVQQAPEGYEDEQGFHEWIRPQPQGTWRGLAATKVARVSRPVCPFSTGRETRATSATPTSVPPRQPPRPCHFRNPHAHATEYHNQVSL